MVQRMQSQHHTKFKWKFIRLIIKCLQQKNCFTLNLCLKYVYFWIRLIFNEMQQKRKRCTLRYRLASLCNMQCLFLQEECSKILRQKIYYIFVVYKSGNCGLLKMSVSWGPTFNAIRRLYLLLVLSEVDMNVGVCYELRYLYLRLWFI